MADKDKKNLTKELTVPVREMLDQIEGKSMIVFSKADDLSAFPEELRGILEQVDVKELVGIAPAWTPKKEGDFVVGNCISFKEGVGKFQGSVATLETPDGAKSLWLGVDMASKMLGTGSPLGRSFVVRFDSWIRKADNPSLANDMRLYRIWEVKPKMRTVGQPK